MTVYYALLIIALVAMLFACLFLYLEIRRYGGFGAVQGRVTTLDFGRLLLPRSENANCNFRYDPSSSNYPV
jgi:uncharacterized membrane protein